MSAQKLILITDNTTKQTSVYTNTCDSDHTFIACVDWLQRRYLSDEPIKYIVTDDYCEIFREVSIVKPGWVWSSKDIQKVSLYTLSWIPIENPKIVTYQSTSTQTTYETNTISTMTETPCTTNNNKNQNYNTNKSFEFNYFEIEDSLESCGTLECTEPLVKDFKRLSLNNFELGTGYANHTFSPLWNSIQAELQSELREKLSSDNMGLRSSKIKLE